MHICKCKQYFWTLHNSIVIKLYKKAIKLIVDIAASDWPHFYPNFFTNLLELLRRKETLSLGLNMLLITSEEARPCPFISKFLSQVYLAFCQKIKLSLNLDRVIFVNNLAKIYFLKLLLPFIQSLLSILS